MVNFRVLIQLTFTAVAVARTLTVVNSCSYMIWPAIFNNAGSSTPNQPAGWQQDPQETISFSVPDDWAGQLWGRRDCDFSATNGTNSCLDGGCDGGLECTSTATPPATIAEFELNISQQDFYDVSLVGGFNIPLSVTNNKGCATASCPVDLNPDCPAELAGPFDASGNPVGCKSACAAGLGDPVNSPNCCTGTHSTPATCPASGVEYYSYFKGNCPTAYAFAYDTPTTTLPCTSQPDYTVTFCP
ncbi:Osmotin thaumatin-like protein [Trametes coccinea BRFM310]|uniref:Osmotin thaumatin-like protein n=1 Tax=Trametes coccinea (strain BRFM310) TaxID=1353009 RepID=A0A1Y2J767_TRAC3|nr:Osmotin thaumatin-like protein [Trametes coccinea BRFM310]